MRILAPLALSAALMLGACQNPDGTVNVPASLALGAGVALAGIAIASANDQPRHRHYDRHPSYGHRGYGYERGYDRGYRRW
ncbi:hypothetical protein G3576_18175 [Roseomonas stagni]|uniref:Lipoprotein n=1 Tax=Falsiroseomonas algicola TaxID=2716930 RepID=A0A6M1LNL5_9PROT|nr:hypothetical protein [Falsiroseomonas algicola]NGM21958.1 hypothetical protein [Falsiroseomonas algicola]